MRDKIEGPSVGASNLSRMVTEFALGLFYARVPVTKWAHAR